MKTIKLKENTNAFNQDEKQIGIKKKQHTYRVDTYWEYTIQLLTIHWLECFWGKSFLYTSIRLMAVNKILVGKCFT